jgi:hypothetical protein
VSCEEEDEEERVDKGEGMRCASLVATKCWSMRRSLAVVDREEIMRKWNKPRLTAVVQADNFQAAVGTYP